MRSALKASGNRQPKPRDVPVVSGAKKGVAFFGADGGDAGGVPIAAVDETQQIAPEQGGEQRVRAAVPFKLGPGGSLPSAGSGGSGDSSLSPTEMIRRGVKARSGRLESSLHTLRSSLQIVAAVVLLTNIATYLVSSSLNAQLLANLQSLAKSSSRANYAQRLLAQVQKFVAHADRSLGFPRYDLGDGESMLREKMRSMTVILENLHKALYLEAETSGDAALFEKCEGSARVGAPPRPRPRPLTRSLARPFTPQTPTQSGQSRTSWLAPTSTGTTSSRRSATSPSQTLLSSTRLAAT